MSTDATIHLHLLIDRLRETQARHSEMLYHQAQLLAEVIRLQRVLLRRLAPSGSVPTSPEPTPAMKWTNLSKLFATSAGKWAGGILAMAWVYKGGDMITAMETLGSLLKLF